MSEYTGANHGALGVQNAAYAVKNGDTYGTPKKLPNAKALALNFEGGATPIYSDNMLKVNIRVDNGYKGNFGFSSQNHDFERDLGYVMDGDAGMMGVSGSGYVIVAIYGEIPIMLDSGKEATIKRWYIECEVEKGSATYNTSTNQPNPVDYQYPITVKGDIVRTAEGEYTDENGNRQKVFYIQSVPGDEGHKTFGDAVPEPIIKTATTEP